MNSLLTLTFLCLLAVGQVFSVFTPSAGASSLVGSIVGGVSNTVPDPTRWIEFVDMDNSWSKLGNSFTVEAWIIHSTSGAATWQPVLSRHPGQNSARQNAHFIIAVKNSSQLEVTAGCGCDSTGANCGNGFYLVGGFTPSVWHHVAVTFNGDNSTSASAHLYIDGVSVDNTAWSATDSQCLHRASRWSQMANVNVGYLDDQWTTPSSEANPNDIFGWWGKIDEIRFWMGVRTLTDIQNERSIGLLGHESGLFAYYQFSPSMDMLNDDKAPKQITNKVSNMLHGLPQPDPTDSAIFAQSSTLIINSYSMVEGQSDQAVDLPILPNPVMFQSWPPSNTSTYNISPSGYSVALNKVLNSNTTFAKLEVSADMKTATLYVDCPNNDCSMYTNDWLSYYIDYTANVNGVTTGPARQYLEIMTACPSGQFDGCGVCDGDNTQCQCVVYHGFESERMSYVLLEWSLQNIINEISSTVSVLASTRTALMTAKTTDAQLRQQISDLMMFYNTELTPYCGDVQSFTSQLMSVTPKATLTAIDQSASPSGDGSLPFVPSFSISF